MIKEIKLPDLGEGIDGAEVSEVKVSVGDVITADKTILVLESDKASMEIPSEVNGKVNSIFVEVGNEIKTGQKLISVELDDKSEKTAVVPEFKNEKEESKKDDDKTDSISPEEPLLNDSFSYNDNKHGFASPGVRRLSRELNINLNIIKGTGAKGRITKDDLNNYIKLQMAMSSGNIGYQQPEIDFSQWGKVEAQKLTKINKITGKRLQHAWQSIPHVTQFDKADITALNEYRKKLNKNNAKKKIKVTFLPFLMKAATIVLKEMPKFNSSLDQNGENLIIKKYFNLGVAVDTPNGLVVPVVKDVDKKSIIELSKELGDLSQRARDKKLKPHELQSGTFTISSLGGVGGTFFTPIINPPEVAILGISQSWWENIYSEKIKNNSPKYIMPFSLSYDHRVIDGVAGASFTSKFSEVLEDISNFSDK